MDETLKMIDELRARGAVEVEVPHLTGVVKARFSGQVVMPLPKDPPKEKSAKEREEEYEARLFASAGSPT